MNKELMTHTENILNEVENAFFDIPFENSRYQTKMFVIQAQQTPARAYRSIGLQMMGKIQAIKEMKYSRDLEDVDIDEWQSLIESTDTSAFEKRRLNIKIRKALDGRSYTDKLLNDAIIELNCLYDEFQKYPKYTREIFESEEEEHFSLKLANQIKSGGNGALMSLETMQSGSEFIKRLSAVNDKKPISQD